MSHNDGKSSYENNNQHANEVPEPPPSYNEAGTYNTFPAVPQPPVLTQPGTTVIVQQQRQVNYVMPRAWSTGLFDCCYDMNACLCGTFCFGCLLSRVSVRLGEWCGVPCFVPGSLIALRLKLRTQHHIEGTLMNDCCLATFCGHCLLCQMERELKLIERNQL